MATIITLNIEAASAAELQAAIADLAGNFGGGGSNATTGEVEGQAESPASPTPATRGRKPKAQDAAPATLPSGSPEPSVGSDAGPTVTTAASPDDPIGAAPTPAAPAPEPAPAANGGLSADAVRAKMQAAMSAATPLAVQNALKEKGLSIRFSEITPEQYATAAEVFDTLVAMS